MNPTLTRLKTGVSCVVALVLSLETAQALPRNSIASQRPISISPRAGQITQTYFPRRHTRPDFVVIQSIHSNPAAQYAISDILKQLKKQGLLPDRIAIEGGKGPIDIHSLQRNRDDAGRRRAADYLLSLGEITGAAHFIVAEGAGDLYKAESPELYQASVEMFRRSYASRIQISQALERLSEALLLLKEDPATSHKVSVLNQDVRVLHHLVNMRLIPEEIHQVTNQAVFAVDHLAQLMTRDMRKKLGEATSAAVNFYALALLRDEAMFNHALELREADAQHTTVVVAGGFHTAGLTQRMSEQGFSYVVITPQVKFQSEDGQRLYLQRLLGYRLSPGEATPMNSAKLEISAEETWELAEAVRHRLIKAGFPISKIRDIFTVLDSDGLSPDTQVAMVRQRARILDSIQPLALRLDSISTVR